MSRPHSLSSVALGGTRRAVAPTFRVSAWVGLGLGMARVSGNIGARSGDGVMVLVRVTARAMNSIGFGLGLGLGLGLDLGLVVGLWPGLGVPMV